MGGMKSQTRAGTLASPMELFAATIVIAAALFVGRQADAGEAGAHVWRVGEIHGEARIRIGAGPWKVLARGDAIHSSAELETSDAGRLRMTGPRGSITVLPNSRLGLLGDTETAEKTPRIIQRSGSLQISIATVPDAPLRIDTPFMTATIAGAAFTTTVNRHNAALYVSDGAARVMSLLTGEVAVVQPGQMAWVNAPSGGRLKTIAVRPRATPPPQGPGHSPARAPRTAGGKVLARLAIGRSQG